MTATTTKTLREMTQDEVTRLTPKQAKAAVLAIVPTAECRWNPHHNGNWMVRGYYVAGCGPRVGGGVSKSEDRAWKMAAYDIQSALRGKFPHFIPGVE
jgi:hypothetical protein